MLTLSKVGRFVGGWLVGFLVIFILVGVDPIKLTGIYPGQGWILSAAGRGGEGKTVHLLRPGLDMRVSCRGACDDIRLAYGAAPRAVVVGPPIAGQPLSQAR